MKTGGRGAHLGGTLSCIEILISLYYSGLVNINKENLNNSERDRVLIGKGHAHIALFHIWSDLNFFDKKILEDYGNNGSKLGLQLDINTEGSEYNTGSLGHVVGIASGIALSRRLDNLNYNIYTLIGDGECEEGSIWEAINFSIQQTLKNFCIIIDRNRLSEFSQVSEEEDFYLENKFKNSGCELSVINGHSYSEIISSLQKTKLMNSPHVIIANTIKGKGVSFMENEIKWHHKAPSTDEFNKAIKELSE